MLGYRGVIFGCVRVENGDVPVGGLILVGRAEHDQLQKRQHEGY